ncbi:hypothetical protein QBC38DRAFT_461559 [Podospora fimiseda]|uniref:Uncharacterized protein n=1 Tax=Podospora fimiseda TaxID=252190 RepID=A0AAN6YMB6_9PEZI|nr:hypothetical protein QBC38DRAFT_461559 [Podospora fimiseda]
MSSTGFRFKDEKENAPTGSIDDSSHMKTGKESKSSSSSTKPCSSTKPSKGSKEANDSSSMPQRSYTEPGEKGFIMKDEYGVKGEVSEPGEKGFVMREEP